MSSTGIEQRKYQRFKLAIPINVGLFDLRRRKILRGQFKGVTTDISMGGMGLKLNSKGSGDLPFGTKMIGDNKEFALTLIANLGPNHVRGVGEVRWISMDTPYFFRMGILLKEMKGDEKAKWINFVMNRSKRFYEKGHPDGFSGEAMPIEQFREIGNFLTAKVKALRIIDGNSFLITPSWYWRRREGDRVRAVGYHCPEMGEPGWEKARTRLENLILYQNIELKNPTDIELGVLVCDVFLQGINIAHHFLEFVR